MEVFTVAILVALSFVTVASFACGANHVPNYNFGRHLKETFTPTNWREFLFPACPFCWIARALVVGWLVKVSTSL